MDKATLMQTVKYDKEGLVPVVVQDSHSKKVRMLAYMNEEALEKTLTTGKVHYFSRSRQKLWLKGETSSYYQYVKGISMDCDGDTLLLQIEQVGGISCHTGNATCFYQEYEGMIGEESANQKLDAKGPTAVEDGMLSHLYATIKERKEHPKPGSYTNYLFEKGIDKILKKVGEESTEVIIAAKDNNKEEITFEIADLMYHLSVLMAYQELTWEEIGVELAKRE